MRGYILRAIVKRDLKETFRNPQSLIIVGITVGINVFMSLAISKPLWVMTFAMSLVMVGFTLTSFIVTEEKDKKTLEALLVSPASYNEILFGKLFLTFSLTVFISLALIFSLHSKEISIIHTLLSVPLGALVICLFGMVVGLICPTQAALSGIGTVLMLGLFLPELLASTNDFVGYIARALPTHHVIQISSLGKDGINATIIKHYAMLVLSLVVTTFWVISFVKTSSKQEGRSWKFDKSNKVYSGLLLLALALSSFIFLPYRGEIIQEDGATRYLNAKYNISVPIVIQDFSYKEYSFQNKFVVKFQMKSSNEDEIYLSMTKNLNKRTLQEDLKKMLDDLQKKDVLNLMVEKISLPNGIEANKIEYESKDGYRIFYMFSTKEFLYRFGINASDKSKNYSQLTKTLNKYVKSITTF